MQKKNLFSIALLALFVIAVVGCAEKNVVQPNQKVGMTAQERKEKRGE